MQGLRLQVRIESTGNKTITLNTSDIKVSGLETGMSYSFEDRTFSIDVSRVQRLQLLH